MVFVPVFTRQYKGGKQRNPLFDDESLCHCAKGRGKSCGHTRTHTHTRAYAYTTHNLHSTRYRVSRNRAGWIVENECIMRKERKEEMRENKWAGFTKKECSQRKPIGLCACTEVRSCVWQMRCVKKEVKERCD